MNGYRKKKKKKKKNIWSCIIQKTTTGFYSFIFSSVYFWIEYTTMNLYCIFLKSKQLVSWYLDTQYIKLFQVKA